MTLLIEDFENTISKFGDQSAEYTEDEEQALKEIFELIDSTFSVNLRKLAACCISTFIILYVYFLDDDEMQPWRKYAQRSLVIVGLRACNLDAKLAFKTVTFINCPVNKFSFQNIYKLTCCF